MTGSARFRWASVSPFSAIVLSLLAGLLLPDGSGVAQVRGGGVGAIFFGGDGERGGASAPSLGGAEARRPSPASLGRSIGEPFGRRHVPGAFGQGRSIGNRFGSDHVPGAFGETGVLDRRTGKAGETPRTRGGARFGAHGFLHEGGLVRRPALHGAAALASARRARSEREAAERIEEVGEGVLRALEAIEGRVGASSPTGSLPVAGSGGPVRIPAKSPRPGSAVAGALGRALRGEGAKEAVGGAARQDSGEEREDVDPALPDEVEVSDDRVSEGRGCALVRIRTRSGIGVRKAVWTDGTGPGAIERTGERLRSEIRGGGSIALEGPDGELTLPAEVVGSMSVGPCGPGVTISGGSGSE